MRKLLPICLSQTDRQTATRILLSHYECFHSQSTPPLSCVICCGYGDNTGLVTAALSSFKRGIILFLNFAFFHAKIHWLFANWNLFYTYTICIYEGARI